MLSTERPQCDEHVNVLCAGFNVPATLERREAYWRGCSKMPLFMFGLVVEHVLGDGGPEKIPTAPQIWQIHRQLRNEQRERERALPQTSIKQALDGLALHGNRVLLSFLRHQETGASQASLLRLIAAKDKLVEQYRWITQDEPSASGELRDKLWAAFSDAWQPRTQAEKDHDSDFYYHTGRLPGFSTDKRDGT